MNPDLRARYETAVEAAQQAGQLALGYYEGPLDVEKKADASPVTIADRSAEELIRGVVGKRFADDGILGEEFPEKPGTSGYRWILDPIDGTKSFIRGVPLWGTLVGVELNDETVIGVCVAPCLNLTYHACRGEGAFRNGRRIHVSDVDQLGDAHMAYSSSSYFIQSGKEQTFLELVKQTSRQRGYGDYYAFMLVAQGSFDLTVEFGCSAWDLAAVKPIVEEAGGKFTDWGGTPTIFREDVLATNGKLHEAALTILRK